MSRGAGGARGLRKGRLEVVAPNGARVLLPKGATEIEAWHKVFAWYLTPGIVESVMKGWKRESALLSKLDAPEAHVPGRRFVFPVSIA